MLETTKPPVSSRTRRLHTTPRPAAPRASSAASLSRPATMGNIALGHAPVAARPMPQSAPFTRQSRLRRSEMRLMGFATTCTAVVCGLLLLYLAAYAQVTRLGIAQAAARTQLRENRLHNELLRAEYDRLQSPQRIIALATGSLHMTLRNSASVEYIPRPSHSEAQSSTRDASSEINREQGTNGGTTTDSGNSTSFHH